MPKIGKLTTKQWVEVLGAGTGCLKVFWALFLGITMPFYATYTFYLLWNWFLAEVVHAGVTYWQSGGILMLLSVVVGFVSDDLERDDKWMGTRVVLAACLPEHKIAAVMKEIVRIEQNNKAFGANMKRFAGFSLSIVLGGLIHTFFM